MTPPTTLPRAVQQARATLKAGGWSYRRARAASATSCSVLLLVLAAAWAAWLCGAISDFLLILISSGATAITFVITAVEATIAAIHIDSLTAQETTPEPHERQPKSPSA